MGWQDDPIVGQAPSGGQIPTSQPSNSSQAWMDDPIAPPNAIPSGGNDLHARQMQAESAGNQTAVSPKGAIGIMQIMPKTGPEAAKLAGLPWDPDRFKNDAQYNETLGRAYQDKQKATFQDDRLALAAYNAGPGRVSSLIQQYGDPAKGQISWEDFSQHLPQETQDYVAKITQNSPMARVQPNTVQLPITQAIPEAGRVLATGIKQGVGTIGGLASNVYRGAEEAGRVPFDLMAKATGNSLDDVLGPVSQYLPSHTPGEYLQQFNNWLTRQRPDEVPQTEGGKAAGNILGSAISGAMLPIPGMQVATGALQGGLAGLGSEIGSRVTGGSDLGRLAGGLALPLGVAGLNQVLPGTVKENLARETLKGVSPYELDVAKQNQTMAQQQHGVDLTLGQSLPNVNNAMHVEQILSQTPGGQSLLNQLRQQPGQVEQAAKDFQVGIPGQVQTPGVANNMAQEAATNSINNAAQARAAVVGPLINGSGDISLETAQGIIQRLNKIAKSSPNTTKGQMVSDLANSLQITKPLVNQAGEQVGTKQIPIQNIVQINDILKSQADSAKNMFAANPQSKESIGLQTSLITGIKNQLADADASFAAGQQAHKDISMAVNNPLKQGPIGAIAGTQGYQDAKAAPEKIMGIFDKGTPINPKTGQPLPSDILKIQKEFATNGPDGSQTFTDVGASWLASRFNKAIVQDSGQPVTNVANSIEQQFFGTEAKRQGFKDVLAGIARSNGVPEKDLVDGGTNFMQTIQRAATLKGLGPGVSDAQIQSAKETPIGFLGRFTAVQPFRQPALLLQRMFNGNAEETISNLLRTPDGISTLQQLAKVQPGSGAAYKILGVGAGVGKFYSKPPKEEGQ